MINQEKLSPVLAGYKAYFPVHWDDEKYKWEAVRHFQEYWDMEAENFGEMFRQATDRTFNLLASGYAYPRGMITNFAKADDEAVRAMFRNLYDESVDLAARVETFQAKSEELREKYDDGTWRSHYQNTNAISTYLWLRYPDKYYIYKYEIFRAVAKELSSDYMPKRNEPVASLVGGNQMYDEICRVVKADPDIRDMIQREMTPACYPDPEFKTATMDVGFYLARFYLEEREVQQQEEWFPKEYEYSPGLSVEAWVELLNDRSIFTAGSLEIMKRMMDHGGQATCKQLSVKYGGSINFYNRGSSSLANRIVNKTGCGMPPERDNNSPRWWPVLYVGKYVDKEKAGIFMWRLRDELAEALEQVDLSEVPLYVSYILEIGDVESTETHGYWWLTANPKDWSFADMVIGEEVSCTLYNDNGNKRRVFQNFLDAKAGDTVICYEANPVKKVVAIARIIQENDGEEIFFEKMEDLEEPIEYANLKECPELEKMEFFVQPIGSLFKLEKDGYDFIMDMIRENNHLQAPDAVHQKKYTKEDFLGEVYMAGERFDVLEALLQNKMNVILQGAPGVGKTFTAKRLAYAMMGEMDDARVGMVQFH